MKNLHAFVLAFAAFLASSASAQMNLLDSLRALLAGGSAEAGTNAVKANLPLPGKVVGVVRQPNGEPAAGLTVRIVGSYSISGTAPKTDANGKFEVPFDPHQFGRTDAIYCLLVRDPERNLAIALEIDEESGPPDLRLAPGMTLVGRAECQGRPLTNALVAVVFWTGNSGMHLESLAVRTGTPGQFEVPALPPGRRYGLSVSAPGYGQQYVTAEESETEAKRIDLGRIELKPANLKLSGRMTDPDDKPVAGAYVNLGGEGQPNGNTRTDRDGQFNFENVCAGSVRLFANANTSQGSTLAQGGDTNVVLKLGQTANYGSDAIGHKLKGVVTDPDGKPVSGAQVAVFPSPSNWEKTGADGAFSLTWFMRSYQVESGCEPCLVVRDMARDLAAAETLSEDTTNLDVRLKPAVRMTGRVEDPEGAPLAGADVGLWLLACRTYSQMNERLAPTDPRGYFEIKTLPAGQKYVVYATAKDHGRHERELKIDPETNRVELPPFVLELADQRIAGRVVNALDKPVSGVHVSLSGKDQPAASASTDSKGRFSFRVCEGTVRLFASGPSSSINTTVEAGDTNIVIQLNPRAKTEKPGRPSRRPSFLEGGPLPDLASVGLAPASVPQDKPLLLCLLDIDHTASRRTAGALAEQYNGLRQRGLTVLAVQTGVISAQTLRAWTNSNPLPFPVGRVVKRAPGTRWATRVEPLPWLVLRDAGGEVVSEGFALDELDAKLQMLEK